MDWTYHIHNSYWHTHTIIHSLIHTSRPYLYVHQTRCLSFSFPFCLSRSHTNTHSLVAWLQARIHARSTDSSAAAPVKETAIDNETFDEIERLCNSDRNRNSDWRKWKWIETLNIELSYIHPHSSGRWPLRIFHFSFFFEFDNAEAAHFERKWETDYVVIDSLSKTTWKRKEPTKQRRRWETKKQLCRSICIGNQRVNYHKRVAGCVCVRACQYVPCWFRTNGCHLMNFIETAATVPRYITRTHTRLDADSGIQATIFHSMQLLNRNNNNKKLFHSLHFMIFCRYRYADSHM